MGGSADRGVTRRDLLATGVTALGPLLAGCPACANSVISWDDRLRVAVEDVRIGPPHEYVLRVTHRGPDDVSDESNRDSFGTRYEGVTIYAFSHDRLQITSTDVGRMEHGTTERRRVESDAFPFIVTATAESFEDVSENSCYYADRGAHLMAYLGEFDSSVSVDRSPETFKSVAGDGGHNWSKIGRLRLDDELPPREWVFQRAKCLQHASMQVDSIPTPSMAALDVDDSWYDEPIEQPTVHREHNVGVKPADTFREGHAEQFKTPHSTLDYETLPGQIKQAIVEERDLGWVSEDEFYRLISNLEGREIDAVDALPDCERSYVVCNDDRGVKCNGSNAYFGGEIGRYFWYHTTYQGRSFVVVPGQVEEWLASDANTPEPCTGSREELFQVTIYGKEKRYRGLESATIGADVPEYLAEWARSDPSSYSSQSVSKSRWVRLIQILEGDESIRLPQCQWENVRCVRNGYERCGSGHREAFYVLEVDGESWWFNFEYDWSGS